MSPATIREPSSFGKRTEPHKIIVVSHGRERQINVNPVVASALVGMVFMFLFGYFGATAYLIFRDDLVSYSFARQARMQHEYEDRIAALRSKLDRVTSRQLLDQQAIETRVKELMARQQVIGERGGSVRELLDEARKRGLSNLTVGSIPAPTSSPRKSDETADPDQASIFGTGGSAPLRAGINLLSPANAGATRLALLGDSQNAFTRDLFGDVAEAIGIIDARQRQEVDTIRIEAARKAKKIGAVLNSIGIKVNAVPVTDIGGPFVPFDHSVDFEAHVEALEVALKTYDSVTETAKTMPLGTPIPGAKISSRYGSRVDPFNGRIAMHGGIDFKAKTGTPVKSTGSGKVVKAGRKGGYGKVVEIQHDNGYTTRYAHLSKILVKVGQTVTDGKVIGKVGSTGRSTGPHLHYEVRRSDKTRDPSKYIKAGYKIRGLL